MSAAEWSAVGLTLRLATVTTLVLVLFGAPLAWCLARSRSPLKPLWAALIAMPLVLPPTVLGFYLLLMLGLLQHLLILPLCLLFVFAYFIVIKVDHVAFLSLSGCSPFIWQVALTHTSSANDFTCS